MIREILREVNTNDSKQKFDQRIYLQCVNENEFGSSPDPDELLEIIDSTKNCLCQRINIKLGNSRLDQILSYKQKLTILRVILRRFQILNRYFCSSKSLTQSDTEHNNHWCYKETFTIRFSFSWKKMGIFVSFHFDWVKKFNSNDWSDTRKQWSCHSFGVSFLVWTDVKYRKTNRSHTNETRKHSSTCSVDHLFIWQIRPFLFESDLYDGEKSIFHFLSYRINIIWESLKKCTSRTAIIDQWVV